MAKGRPSTREAELMAVLIAGEKYGREVRDLYEQRSRRAMPLGSLYTTLDRMEDAGFVTSRLGDPGPDRGGNRRKYYKLTANGIASLNDLRAAIAVPTGEVSHG